MRIYNWVLSQTCPRQGFTAVWEEGLTSDLALSELDGPGTDLTSPANCWKVRSFLQSFLLLSLGRGRGLEIARSSVPPSLSSLPRMASCTPVHQKIKIMYCSGPGRDVGGGEGGVGRDRGDGESRLIPRVLLTSRRQWRGPGGYKVAGLADRTDSSGGSTDHNTSGLSGPQGKHQTYTEIFHQSRYLNYCGELNHWPFSIEHNLLVSLQVIIHRIWLFLSTAKSRAEIHVSPETEWELWLVSVCYIVPCSLPTIV